MKTAPPAKYKDAIFLVTQERSCPFYTVGQEIKVENFGMTISSYKPGCLYLAEEICKILSSRDSLGGFSKFASQQKLIFQCPGCDGKIHFEFKKDKDYATLQMKMLNDAEEKRKRQHLDKFFGVLRKLKLFEVLDDDALSDLTLLLEMKTFPINKIVAKRGNPGTHLFIILQGKLAVLDEDGTRLEELGTGEIFGEMSLLSGEPCNNTIQTIDGSHLAMLSIKNFRQVIVKYPILQLFIFKMLIQRAQAAALKTGNISSGMTGELAEISAVDLFQLIHSSQKTGMVELELENGKAAVFFKDGQIIHTRYMSLRDKDAFFALLSKKNGRFTYIKGMPRELQNRAAIGEFMGLLMEGIQRIDEAEG